MNSLTKAAEKNFVSRPAVSQAIKKLEEWSGRQLITHDKRVFELTQEGQNLFRILKNAFTNFQSALDRGGSPSRSLKIGASSSLIDIFIIPKIAKLSNIENFKLKTGTTKQLQDFLDSEEINISFSIDSNSRNENLIKIIHQGNFIIASPGGKKSDKFVVTEDRPEVLNFRKTLDKNLNSNLIRVESWTTGLKIARALNIACLIPDFLVEQPFKKNLSNFKYGYKVILEHRPFEHLSELEISFIENFK